MPYAPPTQPTPPSLRIDLRSICHLPNRAITHYIFASKQTGGLGLTHPCKENHIQTIVQVLKLLSSLDPVVSTIATRELRQTVRFAAQADPTPALSSAFLSNHADCCLESLRSRTGSLWTRTRWATKSTPVNFTLSDTNPPSISTADYAEPVLAKDACCFLHNLQRDQEAQELRSLHDQGKVAQSLQNDRFANGS